MDAPPAQCRAGNRHASALQISYDARFVRANGVRQELSPAEAAVLLCLMDHAGEPVSRARLQFALRGRSGGTAPPPRAVDFAIRRLRLKLEVDPSQPTMLCTVRGRGYRFVPPPEVDARARTRAVPPDVVRSLTQSLASGGTLVQLHGGDAPLRSGLIRAAIDAQGSPPPGGVLWISGHFSSADHLALAILHALGPGLPKDATIEQFLVHRSPTLLVIDGLVDPTSALLAELRHWRHRAPQQTWVIFTPTPLPIDDSTRHLIETDAGRLSMLARLGTLAPPTRAALATLRASGGPVDAELLQDLHGKTILDALDESGVVRVWGRRDARRASLISLSAVAQAAALGSSAAQAALPTSVELARCFLPTPSADQPWDVLLPDASLQLRCLHHHRLLMTTIAACSAGTGPDDPSEAIAALTLLSGLTPLSRMGPWLRAQGRSLLNQPHLSPDHRALLHLAMAWLELPAVQPIWIGPSDLDIQPDDVVETMGDPLNAARHLSLAQQIAERHQRNGLQSAVLCLRAWMHLDLLELETAEQLAGQARLQSQMDGDATGTALASLILATIAGWSSRPATCAQWLFDAIPHLEREDRPSWAAKARVAYGRLQLGFGRELSAHTHLDAAITFARSVDDIRVIATAGELLAVLEASAGRRSESLLRAREAQRARRRLSEPALRTRLRGAISSTQTG